MKSSKDIRSLIFIAINFLLIIFGLFFWSTIDVKSIIIIILIFGFSFISAHINHNHMHNEIFNNSLLNIVVNIFLSVCIGVPVSTIYAPHVINHHPNNCNKNDWAGGHLAEPYTGFSRIFIYTMRAHLETSRLRPRSPFWKLSSQRKISLVCELIAVISFWGIGISAGLNFFLLHYLLPTFLALNALVFMNFFVHDGCDYNSSDSHSKTFTSKWGNYFLFNNGYHLAHHFNPQLHWSLLEDYYKNKLKKKLTVVHEHSSLFRHFYEKYIL